MWELICSMDNEIDDLIASLYSFSLVQPKPGSYCFSIHAIVHFWGRERLAVPERLNMMMNALNALIHSPYYSDGGGEIYQVAPVDFDLQRSAVRHLEYALEVAEEFIGFWNLRYSADSLNLSNTSLRNSIFAMLDAVFTQLRKLPDYPKPDQRTIRLSSARPLKILVDGSNPRIAFELAIKLLKDLWTMVATIPAILMEQGRLQLSLRWQMIVLPFILTFDPVAFNASMFPDKFEDQIPLSILAIAVDLLRRGEAHAADQIMRFLLNEYTQYASLSDTVQGYARLLCNQLSQNLRQELPMSSGKKNDEEDEEQLTMESIMDVFKFKRAKKHEGDVSEQMNLRLESAELLANDMLRKEDFRAVDIFRQIREKRREFLPSGDVNYHLSCVTLGNTLRLKGAIENNSEDLDEAMALLEEALGALVRLLGDKDYRTIRCMVLLGSACNYAGELARAEQHLSGALVLYKAVSDATLRDKVDSSEKLAETRVGLKKYGMGEYGHFLCWDHRIRLLHLDHDHPESLRALIGWGMSLYGHGSKKASFLLLICALELKHLRGQFDRSTQGALGRVLQILSEYERPLKQKEKQNISALALRYSADLLKSINKKGLQIPLGLGSQQGSGVGSELLR